MNDLDTTHPPDQEPLIPEDILGRLICPKCSGRLAAESGQLNCLGCPSAYHVEDGVPLLARVGASENWVRETTTVVPTEVYEQKYQTVEQATAYNAAYKEKLFKRMSTQREFRLLQRLLGSQERSKILLDLPCGGGRLSPQIAPFTDLIVEADIGEGQVLYGKSTSTLDTPQFWMTASAFHIPFADNSVDGTVCCRLNHHLSSVGEREHLVKELLRVSRQFVIMTFFDYYSIKNTLRRMRRFLDHKPPKMTMTVSRVRELAAENGATLAAYPMLSALSSGHRYALIVKSS